MYVTLEPCAMCAGALVNSRVERLVYGAPDPKAGWCGTLGNLVQDPRLNHRLAVTAGVLQEESAALLRGFFSSLRKRS
jgi:tRNA(adenine34) deaminase